MQNKRAEQPNRKLKAFAELNEWRGVKKEKAMIDKELLDILACPKCKGNLKLKEERLICLNCRKYYLIKEGIPIMLIDEARDLEEDFEGN